MRAFGGMAGTVSEATFADAGEAHIDDEQALCAAAWLLAHDGALAELSEAETSLISASSEVHSPGTLDVLKAAIRWARPSCGCVRPNAAVDRARRTPRRCW